MILQVELTNICNFRCTFCPQSKRGDAVTPGGNRFARPRGYISDELFDLFIQNANRHASTVVLGFFGEQMMHPKFVQLMRRFRGHKYKLWIFSNWSLATPEIMDALSPCDSVRISLDASNAALFDQVRPHPAKLPIFDSIQRNLAAWLARPKRPQTTLMFTESSINRSDRRAFLAKHLPALRSTDRIITKRVISYGGVTDDSIMTSNPCKIPNERRLTVAWDGRCTPCNLDVDIAMNVGNLLAERDIGKIVRGRRCRQVMQAIRKRQGICANCDDANNHRHTISHRGIVK